MIFMAAAANLLNRRDNRPEDMLTTRLLFCYDGGVFVDRCALTEDEFRTLGKILEKYRPLIIPPEGCPPGRIEFDDFAKIIEQVEGVVEPDANQAAAMLRQIQRRVDNDPQRHPSGIAMGDQVTFTPQGEYRDRYPDLEGMVVQASPILNENDEVTTVRYHLVSHDHINEHGEPVHWEIDEAWGRVQVSNYADVLVEHATAKNELTSLKDWEWDESPDSSPGPGMK